MRGHRISFVSAVCLFLYLGAGTASYANMKSVGWKDVSRGIRDFDIMRVIVSPDDPQTVYASSVNSVYKTTDGGGAWDEILSFRGTGKTVDALAAATSQIVFAGTSEGLFRSIDSGTNWEKIFNGIGDPESLVTCIAVNAQNPEEIVIGTGSGIYRTENTGKDWSRGHNMPIGTLVTSVAIDAKEPQTMYAAAESGAYKSTDRGITWKRIFVENISEKTGSTLYEDREDAGNEESSGAKVTSVLIDRFDNQKVYIGTSSGLFTSEDRGLTWRRAGESGLYDRDIRHLVMSSRHTDNIFAATGKGVFRYLKDSESWSEMSNGLVSAGIRFLAISHDIKDGSNVLWAAAEKGIFKTFQQKLAYTDIGEIDAQQVLSQFDHEPAISEIRNAAIEYAEVQPEKIQTWRKAAAKKALLPDVRFEYQKNKSWQKGTYFYSNSSEKYTDDDVTLDRDKDWSISLTWNLGELVWNDDQTSIDSRSKLMVELRDDIVNEVTRLYFERRKVQIEMLLLPDEDIKERLGRELRLQELTAGIDALTDSFLSKRLAQIKRDRI